MRVATFLQYLVAKKRNIFASMRKNIHHHILRLYQNFIASNRTRAEFFFCYKSLEQAHVFSGPMFGLLLLGFCLHLHDRFTCGEQNIASTPLT